MAVAYDASSESHTAEPGSTSESSFQWTHTPSGTPAGVVVFVFGYSNSAGLATAVDYGGSALAAVTGGVARDTSAEPGTVQTYFLGSSVPTGSKTVTVTRTNNTAEMYACCVTVTASGDIDYAGVTLQQEDQIPAEASVDDGSPGSNSLRLAGAYYGKATTPAAGANSTALQGQSGTTASRSWGVVRETTAGQGARSVGFADTSDDWACVLLAIKEAAATTSTPYISLTPQRLIRRTAR